MFTITELHLILYEPDRQEQIFLGGIVSAAGKGIASKQPPDPKREPDHYAVVVERFHHVLRARRTIKAGTFREPALVKQHAPHQKHFEIRLENMLS